MTRATLATLAFTLAVLIGSAAPAAANNGIGLDALDLPIEKPVRGRSAPNPPEPDPDTPPPVVEPDPEPEEPPVFFGEEVPADSVIFVIDKSRSMYYKVEPFVGLEGEVITYGNRFDLAKTNLKRAIMTLPESWTFNVIFYDECIYQWKAERQPASDASKASSFAFIESLVPGGWTNIGGSVAAALADTENQTVVVLSDGSPNYLDCSMQFQGGDAVHRTLIRISNTGGALINTFGVGVDQKARKFLQDVAGDNGGTYTEVGGA